MAQDNEVILINEVPDKAKGRFWNKVEVSGEEECWNWIGSVNHKGYGSFSVKSSFPTKIAHRIAYLLHYGRIDLSLFVCHSCDNPSCCNPNHLWQGTAKENSSDMKRKGRSPRGVKQGHSMLSETDVLAIRAMYNTGRFEQKNIAEKFKTSKGNIHHICANNTWRHI